MHGLHSLPDELIAGIFKEVRLAVEDEARKADLWDHAAQVLTRASELVSAGLFQRGLLR